MIAGLLASALLLASLSLGASAIVAWWRQWPEPSPDRLRCSRCHATARDEHWFAMHVRAQHPETYQP